MSSVESGLAREVLQKRLFLHWLRPERALFGAYAELHAPLDPAGRSVELGCGDGLNTFLRLGGIPDRTFDYYSVLQSDVASGEYVRGMDVYDVPVKEFCVVQKAPMVSLQEGVDYKEQLLARARTLGVYDGVRRHDLSQPLPYADGSVDWLYSNVLYLACGSQ